MELDDTKKLMVITQVSVGGFDGFVTAKMLFDYLEENVGLIWRCRLKTSSTPNDSDPNFVIDTAAIQKKDDYEKVEPHAFVHFALANAAKLALDASGRGELILFKKPLKISLGPQNPYHLNQRRRNKVPFTLSNVCIEIGVFANRGKFLVGWRGPPIGVDFLVDPFDGNCNFLFTRDTAFSFKDGGKHAVIKCNFKVQFLARDIINIKKYRDMSSLILLLQLASSPMIFYRTADDDIEVPVPFDMLDDDDPWIRTTDFTPSGAIGRCNTYRISIPPRNGPRLSKAMDYLKERRVPISDEPNKQLFRVQDEPDFGIPMSDPFFCIQFKDGISFKVLFLVNAVMQKGVINQHQLSDGFFDLLRCRSDEVNVAALKHLCSYRHPVYDAYKRLKCVQEWLLKNPKLVETPREVNDIVEVRRLIITPTKAYCLPPEVELSNRVLRNYREVADRFLRVTFMDEGMQVLNSFALTYYPAPIVKDITSCSISKRTTIFKRVNSILREGFYLCGRKYSFLAFSANQLRDRSAWFFAENNKITVNTIVSWMGKFTNRNIAKCTARMGLCFSSTYATVDVPASKVDPKVPDVERNGYVFSDGIGTLTAELALEVAERLQLTDPPCAYQIRYGGCKGVIACWPAKKKGIQLCLRPSMNKFESSHSILEICSWTRFQPGFLNRQFVTLLSAMDVQDDVFWNMQGIMISKLNQMLVDTDVAFDVLTASCSDQGNTAAIMLSAGFKPQTEPHLRGMLASIRAAQLRDLREKARIFVPSGRWLMGCLDELGVLEQGQCFIQVSNPSLENCFSKHGSGFSEMKSLQVIKGLTAIAKNPCLHPGDVRILEAVDAPGLHHLYDCVVFPQKGERPHTNEASGSDLDGDLYFVTWDDNLIPPSKTSWMPMNYVSAEARQLPRPVKHTDVIEFFAKNMVMENLGTICNAHVVHADLSEYGARDEKCIKLAELAATAVDFPKTGKVVSMPSELKPKLYPDFMGKEDFQSYKSTKILGKLYRQIKDVYDEDMSVPSSEQTLAFKDIPYDAELEIPESTAFIADAWNCKCSYDGQLKGLLGQYRVNGEEEVVSGHIWSMPKYNSKKQGELKERLKHAYSMLRKEFRKVFEHMELDELSDDEKNKMYERKASAWYQVTYNPGWVKKSLERQVPDDGEVVGETTAAAVMLSFPWIAADYLARIKIKRCGMPSVGSNKPINSLAKYLSDRM